MADTSDPLPPAGSSRPAERSNPSIESTKHDDAYDKALHEEAEGMGAAMGAGLGCLGVALAPWMAIGFAILAAIAFIVIAKGCAK